MRASARVGSRRRRIAGFTLLELMIVLVIFGIMSAVALPGFNKFMRSVDLNNNVNRAAMRLRIARQRAITESNTYHCWYAWWNGDWGWWDDDNSDFVFTFAEKWDPGEAQPTWITRTNSGTNPFTTFIYLDFYPNGSASESGTLIYTNSDGYSRSLSVIRSTGMVTVQ